MKTESKKKALTFKPTFRPRYMVSVCWKGNDCIGFFPCTTLAHARETKKHFDKSTPHLKYEHLILKETTTIVK